MARSPVVPVLELDDCNREEEQAQICAPAVSEWAEADGYEVVPVPVPVQVVPTATCLLGKHSVSAAVEVD